MELTLYGTKEPSFIHATKGRRVYPQEYKKKSNFPQNDASENPGDRLQAILDDMKNWV